MNSMVVQFDCMMTLTYNYIGQSFQFFLSDVSVVSPSSHRYKKVCEHTAKMTPESIRKSLRKSLRRSSRVATWATRDPIHCALISLWSFILHPVHADHPQTADHLEWMWLWKYIWVSSFSSRGAVCLERSSCSLDWRLTILGFFQKQLKTFLCSQAYRHWQCSLFAPAIQFIHI